jgi:peptidoglycan/xylan/chitin deacetylase (PgdA/CDA1 family)
MIKNDRDFVGYGANFLNPNWPNNSILALQFVLNLEEGAENCVINGDQSSESFLCDIINAKQYNARHKSVESLFEYGSRIGYRRVLEEFSKRDLPLTIFASGLALQINRAMVEELFSVRQEIAGHGWRWISYQDVSPEIERIHIKKTIDLISEITNENLIGWYTGRDSPNTRSILIKEKCIMYDSDYYGDELPFWYISEDRKSNFNKHLIIPYSLDCNDMRFHTVNGFRTSNEFFEYLKDSFDYLYYLGEKNETPKMMSIGLHSRIIARPGRFVAIQRFLDYIMNFDRVWITRRRDIATHWINNHG